MRGFFNAESLLWKPLGYLGEIVMLSLLWTVFSLPLITLGPASAAVYDAAVHGMRRRDDALISRFFSTFRRELKSGLAATAAGAAVPAAAAGVLYLLLRRFPEQGNLLGAAAVLVLFFWLCVMCWVYPVLSRFAMGTGALYAASLRLALGHILRSLTLALLWGGAVWVGLRFVSPLFALPGLAALLSTYLIEPVFRGLASRQPE